MNSGTIDVIGDTSIASKVYSTLYYEIASVREDWAYGTSPGSLSSDGYNGHMFWDQETWMYPMFLMLHESSRDHYARTLLEYRYNRLDGARINANQTGYLNTARYPWESASSGIEVCPTASPTGSLEIHINIDIQLAVKQYYMVTLNDTWLEHVGWPILFEVSEYLIARGWFSSKSSNFQWLNNMGPDEYHGNINNSVYFNSGALQMINFTIYIAENILNKGGLIPNYWNEILASIYVPYDESKLYHPEFDGYMPNETVKQADVILMQFPWEYNSNSNSMDTQTKYNDLLIYENVTDKGGPAMTWSMFVINWLALNKTQKAAQLFEQSFVNIQKPFNIWTETADGGGTVNFITGGGGWLQTFIFGFGGVRLKEGNYNSNNYNAFNQVHIEINYYGYLYDTMSRLRLSGIDFLGFQIDFEYSNSMAGEYFKPGFNMAIVVIDVGTNSDKGFLVLETNQANVTVLALDNRIFVHENSFPIKVYLNQTTMKR